jgi:hypothetical protein
MTVATKDTKTANNENSVKAPVSTDLTTSALKKDATETQLPAIPQKFAIKTDKGKEILSINAMNRPDYSGPHALTNLGQRGVVNRALAVLVANPPKVKASELGERKFPLKYWVATLEHNPFAVEGQPDLAVKLTLVSSTNETLVTGSGSVIRVLDRIRQVFGEGPYDPPIPCLFTNHVMSNGRRTYLLTIDDPDTEEKVKSESELPK